MSQRIDKILSENNILSRSLSKKAAKQRRITVNGSVVTSAELKIMDNDELTLDGIIINRQKFIYIMMNKPVGYVCSNDDPKSPVVFELLAQKDFRRDLFTAGRLDKNTTGLLVITNDGQLAHRLLSPRSNITKTYFFTLKFPLNGNEKNIFESGVSLENGYKTRPAYLDGEPGSKNGFLTISEGKYHQIKRMFEAVGNKIIGLKRVSFGTLILDEGLSHGKYRFLTKSEEDTLKKEASN